MTDQLLPLQFSLTPAPSPYVDTGVFDDVYRTITATARAAIHRRDYESCRFCGFRSPKYQTIVWLREGARDVDDGVTSCVFCEQVLRIDLAPAQKSGVLVWLPEVSQAMLNRAMYTVYLLRISRDERADRARRLLDRLMSRRGTAKERFGSDNPTLAVAKLTATRRPDTGPSLDDAAAKGLRLLPLDRRVIRESGLEFNQFPQLLAYCRSTLGPAETQMPQASRTFDAFERALSAL